MVNSLPVGVSVHRHGRRAALESRAHSINAGRAERSPLFFEKELRIEWEE